jgi:low temperature requirement protein LtrA
MVARAQDEEHRASTPLELLFDLTFVVAVSQAAASLEHGLDAGHAASAVPSYLMVFFAIWWAWMNFTWFASAYDTDDVPYRLLVLVQMLGVLVLAAGVHQATDALDFRAVTIGYVLMRVAMVVQWLRAAHADPAHRGTALRYAAGIGSVQVLWLLRLLLPGTSTAVATLSFVVLAALELAVPYWAERPAMTTWHPHHIAERYGLFTIIVLGECVLSATAAVQSAVEEFGWSPELLLVGGSGFLLVFAIWWLYFLRPAGDGLERRRELSFLWGYGHYVVFAALGALGAGLKVGVVAVSGGSELAPAAATCAVAVPVAAFVVVAWALHAPLSAAARGDAGAVALTAAATLALAGLPLLGVPLSWSVSALAVPVVALVAVKVAGDGREVERW